MTRLIGGGALVLTAVLAAGCSGGGGGSRASGPAPQPSAVDSGTSVGDLDTTALVVRRAPFCDRIDPQAVTRALGARAATAHEYRSGERARVAGHVSDVLHEFGCSWSASGTTVRAWVFVPPVTAQRARGLVHEVQGTAGCTRAPDAPAYGHPSLSLSCRVHGATEVSYRGLFGDAWLTCTLRSRADDVALQAARWCAAVASGASS